VCASVLAMVIAVSAGISVSFWTGFFSYCIALLTFVLVKRANAEFVRSAGAQGESCDSA